MQPHDTQSQDTTSSYESPKITDLSDGTSPLAAAPGVAPIPSGV